MSGNSNFFQTLKQLTEEKGISIEILVGAIEDALVMAYRRNFPDSKSEVRVRLNRQNGEFKVYRQDHVVETPSEETPGITLAEAHERNPEAAVGDTLEEDVTPDSFGRIAAQTAKQVVSQKLKEAERNVIYKEFTDKVGLVLSGKVQRVERGNVIVEIAGTEAVLTHREQIPGESFRPNDRVKCYVAEVKVTSKGPQILLSRTHAKFVQTLFEMQIPEIIDKIVEVKAIAREASYRTKIAVHSRNSRVDPVGACVGLKGNRIKGIVDELNGEKIDIIRYSENLAEYVTNALSPAKIQSIEILDDGKLAQVVVPAAQLSLAIGKEGMNVKLAAKLTNVKIEIRNEKETTDTSARQDRPEGQG